MLQYELFLRKLDLVRYQRTNPIQMASSDIIRQFLNNTLLCISQQSILDYKYWSIHFTSYQLSVLLMNYSSFEVNTISFPVNTLLFCNRTLAWDHLSQFNISSIHQVLVLYGYRT